MPTKGMLMSDSSTLEPGLTGRASTVVTEDKTANALGSGNVKAYSTPSLIALLEGAAVDALRSHLGDGQTSVGTSLNVKHLAATPVGMTVSAAAVLKEVDGRRLVFEVSASDEVELIGQGTHERFIVDRERFEKRVREKRKA
jgi:fluoroacetyl-CoA thioesterase